MTLTAIRYDAEQNVLELLDQRILPSATDYVRCTTSQEVRRPARQMFRLHTIHYVGPVGKVACDGIISEVCIA